MRPLPWALSFTTTTVFLEGNPGGPGRPEGSQNKFPTNYIRIMRGLIAGEMKERIGDEKDPVAIGQIIAQLYFDGLQGKVKIWQGDKQFEVSPAIFLKLFQDWAGDERDRKLKRDELKKKEKGATGGIRVVLPSPIVDPLLRPGQPPRPLRLMGQDPSKPLEGGAKASESSGNTASRQPRPAEPQTAPGTQPGSRPYAREESGGRGGPSDEARRVNAGGDVAPRRGGDPSQAAKPTEPPPP